jgi:predicted lipoprotein with Yx(FWY)xxD motif
MIGTRGTTGRTTRLALTLSAVALAAVALAACSSGTTAASTPAPAAPVAPSAAAPSSAAPAPSSAAATVMTHTGTLGTYLVDGSGKTLYLYTPDISTTSTCTAACAAAWPPLTVTGTPGAGTGAQSSLLGTSPRADGTTQVTYNGHPLYYFAADKAAGDTTGQGVMSIWYVLGATGNAIK